ncbi:hypothetical protein CLV59_106128 [Chitinophaga dinghuensis]|uniref:Uncharacterized protein n=1 Tax=Chitinophaga dinghuensis TaxID=1539050 RepID=A0A327W2A9_9BACT|nr:hypothetical protein [Chitinophaga dinghuensis]RAJ79068.1 hypothetical protein CLV59_106128 [Chitinophaga dinghuensis]
MIESEEISVFDEGFEEFTKPRRLHILPGYLITMSAIGLFIGMVVFWGLFEGLSGALSANGHGLGAGYRLGIYIALGFGFMLASSIFLMHLLVLLEWKWAIRFQWAGLFTATIILGGLCVVTESMPFLFFATIVFYIFYFFKIFPLKKAWEDAVSWRKK